MATATNMERYPRCMMGTCCVPWTGDFRFDEGLFRRSVAHTLTRGTRHLYIFGTAGEGHAVSGMQFREVTRAFVTAMAGAGAGAVPMVGVISTSLTEVIERVEWAAGIGVREFQISLPSWGTCTEAEAFTFFEQVCGRFPGCSFLHYNLRRAGRLLSAEEYGRVAGAFGNLVGAKLAGATGEEALAVHRAAPRLRLLLTEATFAEACARGVPAGFLVSYASMNWGLARRYYDACVAGEVAEVARLRDEQERVLVALRDALAGETHMDGAFDQMFVKRYLPEFPLRLLPPYAAASEGAFTRFIERVGESCPEWLGG